MQSNLFQLNWFNTIQTQINPISIQLFLIDSLIKP